MAREKAPQDVNDKAQRRVYVLPNELVERIADYQREFGLSSEVEAVRRLLDGALKSNDNAVKITNRVYLLREQGRPIQDAIRDVLWGHPLMRRVEVDGQVTKFILSDGYTIEFGKDGKATVSDENDNPVRFAGNNPSWTSSRHPLPIKVKPQALSESLDDDIPF